MRVLHVEDEADIREVVECALALDPAIDRRSVGCGYDALQLLSIGGWRPDVLLVDVVMPRMSGTEFVTALRAFQPHLTSVPLVFLTARSMPAADVHGFGAALITKPFEPLSLAARLRWIAEQGALGHCHPAA